MKKIWLVIGIVLILFLFLWLTAIPNLAPRPKMRGALPEAREGKPREPAAKRFGGGVVRESEKPVNEE
jgi:hypothetical protein